MKKLHARELSRNQSILRFEVILQHDWPKEQCPLHSRVFFGGETKRPCFDLLIKQITNTYQNNFSRSYENRSISILELQVWKENSDWGYLGALHRYPDICEDGFFPVLAFRPHITSVCGHQKRKLSKTVPRAEIFWVNARLFSCGRTKTKVFECDDVIRHTACTL